MYKKYIDIIKSDDELVEVNIVSLFNETLKILNSEVIFSDAEKRLYLYKDGFWQPIDKEVIIGRVWKAFSEKIFPRIVMEKKKWKSQAKQTDDTKAKSKLEYLVKRSDFFIGLTNKKIKELIESLSMACNRIPDVNYNKIPLKNGFIDIDDNFKFYNTDRYIYNRYRLGFNFFPTKKMEEPKYFLNFLKQILPDEQDREFLLNWMAYMLIIGNYRQKALFLHGGGRNGKGVLSRIIYKLVGGENCATLTVKQLSGEGYFLAGLNNRLLNISPDSDDNDKIDIGAFKTLTGNDNITVRDIYAKAFNMIFQGKLLFSINKVPYFSTKDTAIMERVEILNFPITIREQDRVPNLENIILEKEGDLIFNFLLERLKELKLIDFKFKAPDSVVNFTNEVMDEQDNISSFIIEYMNDNADETKWEIQLTALYNLYKNFSIEAGFKSLNRTNFKENLVKWTQRRKDIKIEYKNNGKNYIFAFARRTSSIPVEIENLDGTIEHKQLELEEIPF